MAGCTDRKTAGINEKRGERKAKGEGMEEREIENLSFSGSAFDAIYFHRKKCYGQND